jgi:hypothetical protein
MWPSAPEEHAVLSDPFRLLSAEFASTCRRQPLWADGTPLEELVAVIRVDDPGPERSDAAVRAVLADGGNAQVGVLVVLHALAPRLRLQLSPRATAAYRADALAELAIVVGERELGGRRLARRMVSRAHSRTFRHYQRACDVRGVEVLAPGEWLADAADAAAVAGDVDDLAALRVDLGRFSRAMAQAVTDGVLTEGASRAFLDHRLRPVLTPADPRPSATRVAALRAGRRLAALADQHLRCRD